MSVGQPYDAFWRLTLAEVSMILKGLAARRKYENDLALFTAWHAAAFTRAKKLPSLAEVVRPRRDVRRQTAAEQQAIAERWQRALSSTR